MDDRHRQRPVLGELRGETLDIVQPLPLVHLLGPLFLELPGAGREDFRAPGRQDSPRVFQLRLVESRFVEDRLVDYVLAEDEQYVAAALAGGKRTGPRMLGNPRIN